MHKKDEADIADYVFGKVQPQALELEEAVLGAILLDKDALGIVSNILKSKDDFYSDQNKAVYGAVLSLASKYAPIDLLTVTEELKKSGQLDVIGGGYYLVEMTNRVGSSANIEYHAHIVKQKSIQRQLGAFGMQLTKNAFEDVMTLPELLQMAERGIFGVTNNNVSKVAVSVASLAVDSLKRLDEARKNKDGITGVPTGFDTLDGVTGGWQPSDLMILAARPAQGKTALALNLAMNAAKEKVPVAFFSLEMSSEQLMDRLLSSEARVNGNLLKRGRVPDSDMPSVISAVELISELPIFIDDTPALSIGEFRSKCRQLKMQHDIGFVVVDYLQLMVGERLRGDSRDVEIGTISKGLKNTAKELGVPVIALSQLSRDNEKRGGSKRPLLSDLRESGNIEQDADIVMFIHRPEYYGVTEDSNGNSLNGVAEIIFAKHRNGAVGTEELMFESRFTLFSDKKKEPFDPNKFVKKDVPTSDPFVQPFTPQKVMTVPSKMNDDEDIPF